MTIPSKKPDWMDDFKADILKDLCASISLMVQQEVKKCTEPLEKRIKQLEIQLVRVQNHSRRANIEILGVPKSEKEDLRRGMLEIVTKMGYALREDQILAIHRIGKDRRLPDGSMQPPAIVAELRNRVVLDEVMDSVKTFYKSKGNVVKLGDIWARAGGGRLFIRRQLCETTKYLLRAAKRIGAQKGYKYIWVADNGKVLARREEGSEVVAIAHEDDLRNL